MPATSPFIVAEMSANHLKSLPRALEIVQAAANAGADAIKVQTWSPGTMCISDYRLEHGPWAGRFLRDLYEEAFLPWEWHLPIFTAARAAGLVPFSAAFDRESVDFLETLGVDRHKVASFELTDLPLIEYMASKKKPMILSTGMATADEIAQAIRVAGPTHQVTLLKCTSAYPALIEDANLMTLSEDANWGVSDHSLGTTVAVAAAARGARYIEKHLTLSTADGGPDAGFSMEPAEFARMVRECRRAAATIGKVAYGPGPHESTALRRSLWVKREIRQGEKLVLGENVVTARPALGASPATPLGGAYAARQLFAGEPLCLEDIQ